jgi:hypothetical protein
VKPRVLAVDLDGTIAVNDTVDLDVAAAIQEARRAGLLVVLVTGRPLSDVDALFRGPPPFDAIVAENGAVLRLPELPSPITLSQGPDLHFLAELKRRRIPHQRGQCVVGASADVAPQLIEIIRSLGLPLAITFNLSRLMVLPHGVSKASGLQKRSGVCGPRCTTPLRLETRRTITTCSRHARSAPLSPGAAKR